MDRRIAVCIAGHRLPDREKARLGNSDHRPGNRPRGFRMDSGILCAPESATDRRMTYDLRQIRAAPRNRRWDGTQAHIPSDPRSPHVLASGRLPGSRVGAT